MSKALLSDAVDDYLRHRTSQDYSKGTINGDRQVLKRFLAITGNIWCHALDEKHVRAHFEEVSRTRGPSSLRNDHGVLGRFFEWARQTGRMPMDNNPLYGRRQPRKVHRERFRLASQDFPRLLEAAGHSDPRDRALVAILLYTLLRDSEVTSLRVGDLDLRGGWISAKIHKSKMEDRIPICSELDEEMRVWLNHYQAKVGHLDPGYYLVPPRVTNPIHGENGRIVRHHSDYRPTQKMGPTGDIVKRSLKAIGVPLVNTDGKPMREGAHTLRRSGARALFDQLVAEGGYDHPLRVVQSLLHHSSVQMTETYIGITADRRSRDDILRGKRMYAAQADNVVQLAR
ncbi:MAG: tyrosine-type recombinase/integrase [Mycobacteriaceae bacterium]